MGFGSYDESEQQNQESDDDYDEEEGVDVHGTEHEGTLEFTSEASRDELVDKLQDIKGSDED